jgi:hypothetical protein
MSSSRITKIASAIQKAITVLQGFGSHKNLSFNAQVRLHQSILSSEEAFNEAKSIIDGMNPKRIFNGEEHRIYIHAVCGTEEYPCSWIVNCWTSIHYKLKKWEFVTVPAPEEDVPTSWEFVRFHSTAPADIHEEDQLRMVIIDQNLEIQDILEENETLILENETLILENETLLARISYLESQLLSV